MAIQTVRTGGGGVVKCRTGFPKRNHQKVVEKMKDNMTLDSSVSPSSNILISQFNPLTPKNDQHSFSPYSNTEPSNIKVEKRKGNDQQSEKGLDCSRNSPHQ